MARKNKILQITDDGRDKGKSFLLTEMPASQGEKWAGRALMAVLNSGIELPPELFAPGSGMAALAVAGIRSFARVPWSDIEPLLDEMMACVQVMPDHAHPEVVRGLIEDDIEEIRTRVQIRAEVFTLHTGFSFPAAPSS